jgi:hypothetical protein
MTDGVEVALIAALSSAVVGIIAAYTTYRGARVHSKATLEEVVNEKIKIVLETTAARHSKCEEELGVVKNALREMESWFRESLQFSFSMMSHLKRQGVTLPNTYGPQLQKLIDRSSLVEDVLQEKDK